MKSADAVVTLKQLVIVRVNRAQYFPIKQVRRFFCAEEQ